MKIIFYTIGLGFMLSLVYFAKVVTEMALMRIIPPKIIRAEKIMLVNTFAYLYMLLFMVYYFIM